MKPSVRHMCAPLLTAIAVFVAVAAWTQFATGENGAQCQLITSAGDAVPGGFGSPLNLYSPGNLLLSVSCAGDVVTITAGTGKTTDLVYRHGYEWKDGMWERFSYEGASQNGAWLVGSGYAFLEQHENNKKTPSFVLAYVCQSVDGAWKCGCRDSVCADSHWQVQTFIPKTNADVPEQNEPLPNWFTNDLAQDELLVFYPSVYEGTPGTRVTLTGNAFTDSNKLYFNDKLVLSDIPADSPTQLTYTVPSLSPGKYVVTVGNKHGREDLGAVLWITTEDARKPRITSIHPSNIEPGATVTITGENFTPTGNDVITSFAVLSNLASHNGTTLEFVYDPFDTINTGLYNQNESGELTPTGFPQGIAVANTNGISSQRIFIYTF